MFLESLCILAKTNFISFRGGIDIKPSANMYLMKADMGGAATVMAAAAAIGMHHILVPVRVRFDVV